MTSMERQEYRSKYITNLKGKKNTGKEKGDIIEHTFGTFHYYTQWCYFLSLVWKCLARELFSTGFICNALFSSLKICFFKIGNGCKRDTSINWLIFLCQRLHAGSISCLWHGFREWPLWRLCWATCIGFFGICGGWREHRRPDPANSRQDEGMFIHWCSNNVICS